MARNQPQLIPKNPAPPAPGAQSSVEPLRRVVLHAHVQQRRGGAGLGRATERRAQQVLRQAPAAVLGVHRDAQQVEPGRSAGGTGGKATQNSWNIDNGYYAL